MQATRKSILRAVLPLLLVVTACVVDETVDDNQTPIANAGKDRQLDYDGTPVSVTLDGSKSLDHDGDIVTYRWLSAALVTDGGPSPIDPKDVVKPRLELDQGTYTFTLWVEDNRGSVSMPDNVTINIGTDPVVECAGGIPEVITPTCGTCLCAASADCRSKVAACDGACWDLIACIGQNCPDTTDVACISASCADLFGGLTGAMGLTDCFTPCADACAVASGADAGN